MNKATTILLFVKAPVAGRVKTRLHPVLSPTHAAVLYRAIAQDTLDTAARLSGPRTIIAYDPHVDFPDPSWLKGASAWFPQKGATLGERLTDAIEQSRQRSPGALLVIGTDLPELTVDILADAAKRLDNHDVVLGPAADGGYYLIGLKRPYPALFRNIPWSTAGVMDATVSALKQEKLSYGLLETMNDLDTPEDLCEFQTNPERVSPHFKKTQEALHACHTL